VAAAVINSVKLAQKDLKKLKIIINGGGAAGISIAQMMLNIGVDNVIILDTHGSIFEGRTDNMNSYKTQISSHTNPHHEKGDLKQCIKNADIFIGVSAGNTFSSSLIPLMSSKPIIMALANPTPEILPPEALAHGAFIICTGRSDFPNQVNNSLVFPGLFRAVIDTRSRSINVEMKLAAAHALAEYVLGLAVGNVIPSSLDT
jgi:malate dehydrogenase (oxaloacetate-decarboxylating)